MNKKVIVIRMVFFICFFFLVNINAICIDSDNSPDYSKINPEGGLYFWNYGYNQGLSIEKNPDLFVSGVAKGPYLYEDQQGNYIGKNGTMTYTNGDESELYDSCGEGSLSNQVTEAYCTEDGRTAYIGITNCYDGCFEGACIYPNEEISIKECSFDSDCREGYTCDKNAFKCILKDECICSEILEPVCGINEKTYSNKCFAKCDNVEIAYNTECFGLFDFNIIDLVGSNNPEKYLGEYIAGEFYSNWKNHPPLVAKVNELTAGMNNDYDKAVVIGNWVKNSKPYDEKATIICGANNVTNTVKEIFDCYAGVCLDAAVINTAMLRIAGIPARVLSPRAGAFHAYTEAYLDGKWTGFDSTFGSGEVSIFNNISSPVSTSFQNESENLLIDKKDLAENIERLEIKEIGGENFNLVNVTYTYSKHLPRENFGYLYYPYSEDSLAHSSFYEQDDHVCTNFGFDFDENRSEGSGIFIMGIIENLRCSYYYCSDLVRFEEREKKEAVSLATRGYFKGLLIDDRAGTYFKEDYMEVQKVYPSTSGYFRTTLPEGDYSLYYSVQNCMDSRDEIYKKTAVYNFSIKKGESTIIKPEMLLRGDHPEKTKEEFDFLIEFLKTKIESIKENELEEKLKEELKDFPKILCQGCLFEEKCYSFGYRIKGKFCSAETNEFVSQKQEGNSCDNNFECSTNLCVDGECISSSFLQKVFSWFKKLLE